MMASFSVTTERNTVQLRVSVPDVAGSRDVSTYSVSIASARALGESLIEAARQAEEAETEIKRERLAALRRDITAKKAELLRLEAELQTASAKPSEEPAAFDMSGIPLNHMA